MNANKIADELEIFNGFFVKPSEIVKDSIVMLRQQQAEIEKLKIKNKQQFDYIENLLKQQFPR